jgi:hypothetical protein
MPVFCKKKNQTGTLLRTMIELAIKQFVETCATGKMRAIFLKANDWYLSKLNSE